jgi:hypothetical protein
MAVGDVVSGIFTASTDFQPAAGVECLITHIGPTGANEYWYLYNGTDIGLLLGVSAAALHGLKCLITNSVYLRHIHSAGVSSYSGVQIK